MDKYRIYILFVVFILKENIAYYFEILMISWIRFTLSNSIY